ncbi:peptidase M48 [Hydrogenophaga borbori]|uniref:Peptidase M48 n=1 Tax=Hydrogenophaga borbori TaxID=2294117 RepID=A0A372EGY5_9BURK|nr:M48 family metalloprotease [Hydrogenophaga borbori]RFP77703.1 peptidase M48 [Hydrogenophaga borbori]
MFSTPAAPRRPPRLALSLLALALAWPMTGVQAQTGGTARAPAQNPSPSANLALPSLGDGEGLTVSAERRLGDRIARSIYRDPDYLDDPMLVDYLQLLWQPLLAAAKQRGEVAPELAERLAWELMISRDRSVNAFALPGGYLGVNLGLLAVTERPEELASVLAHELSHVSQRHIARMMSNEQRMAPWMIAAMVLGALAAGSNPQAAGAAVAGGTAVAAQQSLKFSRDMEREADRVGFGVLTGAGFDGQGFVSMFDKLQQASRLNDDGAFPYLRSHPLTGERIADMQSRLPSAAAGVGPRADAPVRPMGLPSAAMHALASARARVLAERNSARWSAWVQTALAPTARPGELYAGALSAQRLGQRERALELAQRLRAAVAGDARGMADALMLELLLSPGMPANPALLAELRDGALASGSRGPLLLGAQAAIASGEAGRAASRLQAWVVDHPRDAQAWQILARAQQALGHTLRAVRAEAEARAAQFDWDGALERLRAAQALPPALRNADPIELAIVDSRRRDVEERLREAMREEDKR